MYHYGRWKIESVHTMMNGRMQKIVCAELTNPKEGEYPRSCFAFTHRDLIDLLKFHNKNKNQYEKTKTYTKTAAVF